MTEQSMIIETAVSDSEAHEGVVAGPVAAILRLEALVVLIGASICYAALDGGWRLFAILFLLPDITMLGYVAGKTVGAMIYNAGHTYLAPACLAGMGFVAGAPVLVSLALIWVAHIGFDRLMGYGLKYSSGFQVTHLHAGGRGKSPAL